MKGIVLAGGTGTRLYPATLVVNKQLLPVYDKPMIYYPLSVLMMAEVREILIISSPDFLPDYRKLFGDGSALGLTIDYCEQPRPEGLPQAFTLARDWIAGAPVTMILGDNIFYGNGLVEICQRATNRVTTQGGAVVFGYHVPDPQRYGVIGFDDRGRVTSLDEKPASPRSNCVMTGLYFFDGDVSDRAAGLAPSVRGELEITDLAQTYLDDGTLHVEQMGRGYAWLDTGTHDRLLEAAEFVRTVQHRQGIQIACLEEIAYHLKLIDAAQSRALASALTPSPYGEAIVRAVEADRASIPPVRGLSPIDLDHEEARMRILRR